MTDHHTQDDVNHTLEQFRLVKEKIFGQKCQDRIGCHHLFKGKHADIIERALSQSVAPDGWKLVPLKATQEMISAVIEDMAPPMTSTLDAAMTFSISRAYGIMLDKSPDAEKEI